MTTTTAKTALVYDKTAPLTLAHAANTAQVWMMQTFGVMPDALDIQHGCLRFALFGHVVEITDCRQADPDQWSGFWGLAHSSQTDAMPSMTLINVWEAPDQDHDAATAQPATAQDILSGISAALARQAAPDAIAWNAPDNWLDAADFFDRAHKVRPRRARVTHAATARPVREAGIGSHVPLSRTHVGTRTRLPCRTRRQMALHEQALRDLRHDTIALDPHVLKRDRRAGTGAQNLRAWTLTTTVAIVAPPVGAALAVANLAGGATYRTAAHMLGLTGFLIALSQYSGLAQALFVATS